MPFETGNMIARAHHAIQNEKALTREKIRVKVSQGNITAAITWFAISTGITAGLSYYREKQ